MADATVLAAVPNTGFVAGDMDHAHRLSVRQHRAPNKRFKKYPPTSRARRGRRDLALSLELRLTLSVVRETERDMLHKVFGGLDDEQREALLELADLGTAMFSAGLAVAVLKAIVGLFT